MVVARTGRLVRKCGERCAAVGVVIYAWAGGSALRSSRAKPAQNAEAISALDDMT